MRGRWIIQRWAAVLAACLLIAAATALAARGGDLDPTFGDSGKLATDLGVRLDGARAIAVDSERRVLVAGSALASPTNHEYVETALALARFLPDGSLDRSFGADGVVRTDFGNVNQSANAVTIDSRGRILAGGLSYDFGYGGRFAIARYLPDGTLDESFSGDGKVSRYLGNGNDVNSPIVALGIDTRGRIAAAGTIQGGRRAPFALRFLRDGTPDSSFGNGGASVIHGASSAAVSDLVLRPHGSMDLIGSRENARHVNQLTVWRLSRRGNRARGFGRRGIKTFPGALGKQSRGYAAALDDKRRLVVAGLSSKLGADKLGTDRPILGHPALIRMQRGGKLDRSFGRRGALVSRLGGDREAATAVALDSRGRLVVGGYSNATGTRDFALLRQRRDGRADRSFGSSGQVLTDFSGTDEIQDLALVGAGRILAGGFTSAGGGDTAIALARYEP